jgi:hypothetical protein
VDDDGREHAVSLGHEGMFGKDLNKYSPKISVLGYLKGCRGIAMVYTFGSPVESYGIRSRGSGIHKGGRSTLVGHEKLKNGKRYAIIIATI